MRQLCWLTVLAAALAAPPASARAVARTPGTLAVACEVFQAWRTVRQLRHQGADPARIAHAQARLTAKKQAFCHQPAVQLLKGAFVDGPKELLCHVKAHPYRTAAILAGAVGLCTVAGMAGIPIDTIALWTSAGLTAKVIAGNWRKVHAAFKRHSRLRWQAVGEDLIFPAAAFAAGLGMGAVVEGATEAAHANGALGVGLKSTAQSVDDLVPITEVLGGSKGANTAKKTGKPVATAAPSAH